jgi:hypothetical protein
MLSPLVENLLKQKDPSPHGGRRVVLIRKNPSLTLAWRRAGLA